MQSFHLTPTSINYLTLLIFSCAVTVYLAFRFFRKQHQSTLSTLLVGFFSFVTIFIGLMFLDVSLMPKQRLYVVFLENPALGFAIVLLLQFAYHFPSLAKSRRIEALIVLVISLSYALYETGFAAYRFYSMANGTVLYRDSFPDYVLAALLFWVPLVLLRQALAADPRPVSQLRKLWSPQGHIARGAHGFAFTYMILSALALVNILRAHSIVSTSTYNILLSMGILLTMVLFVSIYLSQQAEVTSFMLKLSGYTLAVLLALLGIVGWVIVPPYLANFKPEMADSQAVRFTPDGNGGYQITPIPYNPVTELGDKLTITTYDLGRSHEVDFEFPFCGEAYSKIFVTGIGTVQMGEPLYHPNLQDAYGHSPFLAPLLIDLYHTSTGGVYALVESDRVVFTWDHLPALYDKHEVYTFQAVLYNDGSFDFIYIDLPDLVSFDLDNTPSANPWVRGIFTGTSQPVVITYDIDQVGTSPARGLLQDYNLTFRQYLHQFLSPLAVMVLVASLFVLICVPILLYSSLIKPFNSLLAAVGRVEAGDLTQPAPILFNDEIGSLTDSFNRMAAKLHSLITGLEALVAERVKELEDTNSQLRDEIARRETAQNQVLQQQRTLAALQERERLGQDLHDGLGQVIGAINVQTQAAQSLLADRNTAEAIPILEDVVRMAQKAYSDVRNFILGLRSSPEGEQSLFDNLQEYITKFSRETGIQVNLNVPEQASESKFAITTKEQVMYVVREGLNNIRKHANAQQVEISFRFYSSRVQMIISDDGIGFEEDQQPKDNLPHFGLSIMQERITSINGSLKIHSVPGQGTRLTVSLPLNDVKAQVQPKRDIETANSRILLVDDSPIFLAGLHNLLSAHGLLVAGLASDGIEAQEKTRLLNPDIIVMDINMPKCDGLEATRAIKAEFPEIKIVMLTVSEDDDCLFEAMKNGASGYLLKSLDARTFLNLLSGLARGEAPLTPEMASRLVAEFSRSQKPDQTSEGGDLTDRQWQILDMAARGLAYKQIALSLNLSEATIKYHMGQIMERLHLKNRAEVVGFARRMKKVK